jgi:hypothetical protein
LTGGNKMILCESCFENEAIYLVGEDPDSIDVCGRCKEEIQAEKLIEGEVIEFYKFGSEK